MSKIFDRNVTAGSVSNFVFYQAVSHYNTGNTVAFNLLNRAGTFIQAIESFQQTVSTDGSYITYSITIPRRAGDAVIQSVFNTTVGGGGIYYSCVDVSLSAAPSTTDATSTTGAASAVVASFAMVVVAIAALL
jgi:hypothetical protein